MTAITWKLYVCEEQLKKQIWKQSSQLWILMNQLWRYSLKPWLCNTSGHGFKSWTSLNFFQALVFTTGSVVFITSRITFIFLYVELVIKKTCCYTLCPSVVNRTALIFLAKLRVVTWSIKKQTQDDNGTEKMKLLLSRDDSSTGKRVLVICDCWI